MHYKQPDVEQLRIFCAIVECNNNMTKTAEKLSVSRPVISLKMKVLKKHLGYDLFIYNGKIIIDLTDKGKLFYNEAKGIVQNFNSAFNKPTSEKIKIKNTSKIKILAAKSSKFLINKWNKMLVKITLKRVFFIAIFTCGCTWFYLNQTNYFFDRKLEQTASPLLKQIIKDGYYRLQKSPEAFEGVQMSVDMFELLVILTKEPKYKDITVASILLAEDTMTSMRFTGNDAIDEALNDKKNITHNTNKIFLAAKESSKNAKILFDTDKNFRVYNLYHGALDDCLQCNVLFDNVKKYPEQLFVIKADKNLDIMNFRGWIIKYQKYYYLAVLNNISPNNNQHKLDEQFIIWKKLTLDELIKYDNGSYWKLIKDYKIKID